MRILVLTNFYPPFELGGQGQTCRDVVEDLKQRGHQIVVLTSMHGTNNEPVESNEIFRSLYLEMDFVAWRQSLNFFVKRNQREKHNMRCFERVFEQFEPDIVFVWGIWNLPYSLPVFVESRCSGKVVYRFGDYWPTLPSQQENYWRVPGRSWVTRLPKRLLRQVALAMLAQDNKRPPLKFQHAICISAAARRTLVEAGIPVSEARIIHNGIDAEPYLNLEQDRRAKPANQRLELLYAGRLFPYKGVDTAIKALAKLVGHQQLGNIQLSLVGAGPPQYENYLRRLVAEEGLDEYVSFLGRVPPETMPALFRQFDLLLFPSIWPEPFGRVVLEAMISGLVVIVTPTGGPGEIVTDGQNGLLFAPGDADDLAQKVTSLAADPELRQNLAQAGQETVRERFTVTRMMDAIENYLQEIALDSTK